MDVYETAEHRSGLKDCRCDRKICGRKPCRCDRVRVSGDAGEDIGKEKTETAPVEKAGYPEALWTSGTQERDAGIQDLRMEYQQPG